MNASLSRLWELVTEGAGTWTTGGLLLRLALVACSVFALVQLLSMLGTRYGDRNPMMKSFFLSLLLHCCLGLGWATVAQSYPLPALSPSAGADEADPTPIRVMTVGEEDVGPEAATGDIPAWTRGITTHNTTLSRVDLPERDLPPLEDPLVAKAPSESVVQPVVPDLPSRLDEPVVAPTQQAVAAASVPSVAQPTGDIDHPIVEARPETTTAAMASRQTIRRESSSVDNAIPRVEPQRGAAERLGQFIEDGAVLTLPTEVTPEGTLPKPFGGPTDSVQRRASPSPIPADVAEVGSNSASTSAITTGDRKNGKFARTGSRTSGDPEFDPSPTVASRPSTQTTGPDARMLASRGSLGSLGSEFPTDSTNPQPQPVKINTPAVSSRQPTRAPETYRARRIEQRREIALKNGGSASSERAVEASLRWMASVQEADGRWSSARHGGGSAKKDPQGQDRLDGGLHADTGVTGLVILSFLGAGYTHDEGQYEDVVRRALDWLIAQQWSNGYLGGKATRYDQMYCHAIATFALAEAYGMQTDPDAYPELRDAVRGGVSIICAMQNEDGGWRYGKSDNKGPESDMSMFGWQLMALKSAVNAGVSVPEETRRGMTKFLQARALGSRGGLAGYKANERPTPAMTAEALFCRQMFGVRPSDAASQEAASYLKQNLPRLAVYDEYYWYYGTLAMFQYGGEPWDDWNSSLRDTLIGLQRTQGPLAGSWDPKGKWAGIGGRLYSTAVSTMCLEVYYRFLRIYQTDEE